MIIYHLTKYELIQTIIILVILNIILSIFIKYKTKIKWFIYYLFNRKR